ncbi:hypothetical protein HLPCO_000317 [Haloplasma contractile SSD-17B]|uniref:DUF624 domain-containing protein n=1 Tax=Haloplasma contractile SSD-17B TaxID=1033810 RepID=U2EGA7_9MOLU|nr:hypothetical protein HLPCO_000317 [Haloplasma contractile SSD-17B]
MDFEGFNRSIVIRSSYFVTKMLLLNTILIVFSFLSFGLLLIPITVGIFTLYRKMIMKEPYYFWTDLYHGIKNNLKVSLPLSVVFMFLGYLLWFNINNLNAFTGNSVFTVIFTAIVAYGMFLLWIYGSAIISRFDVRLLRTINFSFLIGNAHIFNTICMILFLFILIYIFNYISILLIFIVISLYLYIISFILFRILKLYEPK